MNLNKGVSIPIIIILVVVVVAVVGVLVWQLKPAEERIEKIYINYIPDSITGEKRIEIFKKEENWMMKKCLKVKANKNKALCGEKKIKEDLVKDILSGIKNTSVSTSSLEGPSGIMPNLADTLPSYEVSIKTSQRWIWAEDNRMVPWRVFSQISNQVKLFEMEGEEISEAISALPSVEAETPRNDLDWKIPEPPSLLNKYLPENIEGLKTTGHEENDIDQRLDSQGQLSLTTKETPDFLDFAGKGWKREDIPEGESANSRFSASVMAFKDMESMKWAQRWWSDRDLPPTTDKKVEEVEKEGLKGIKYVFTREQGRMVTGVILVKDNLLFLIEGMSEDEQDVNDIVERIIDNLELQKEPPQYIIEGEPVDFEGALETPNLN